MSVGVNGTGADSPVGPTGDSPVGPAGVRWPLTHCAVSFCSTGPVCRRLVGPVGASERAAAAAAKWARLERPGGAGLQCADYTPSQPAD
jgi:hypothetical protein